MAISNGDRQYIGRLIKDTELEEKEPIFINKNDALQYLAKSQLLPSENESVATGYIDSFDEGNNIGDDPYKSYDNRVGDLADSLKNKLLMYFYKHNTVGDFKKLSRANIINPPLDYDEESKFYSIPVFMSNNEEIIRQTKQYMGTGYNRGNSIYEFSTYDEFVEKVKTSSDVGKIYGYAPYPDFIPMFVAWKDADGKLYAMGKINQMSFNSFGKMKLGSQDISKIPLQDCLNSIVYHPNINPSIMFIPEKCYNYIVDEFTKKSLPTQNEINIDSFQNHEIGNENLIYETVPKISTTKDVNNDNKLIEIDTSKKTDELLLKLMDYHSQRQDIYYSMKDLINFHTAVKSSKLVILSGLSGIGKSKIVDIYARALGISNSGSDDCLLFVPVRPSWNDDADLLGYVDLVHMVYRPSDTGFVDFLVKAQEGANKDKLFIVCFDEMNLARVEHYFSQFISILERSEGQRVLQLYDDKYTGRLYNSQTYPSKVIIGDNIRFIGTVNIDESTYHFSDKVLDRANVIELEVINYSNEWIKKNYGSLNSITWTKEEYQNIIKTDEQLAPEVKELLWEMHSLMQAASSKYGIGPRVVRSIGRYLNNMPIVGTADFDKKQGLDCQIMQRVLTKVRGPESQLGGILDVNSDGNFIKLFDRYNNLSDFEKCRKVVLQKQKELASYGYCI